MSLQTEDSQGLYNYNFNEPSLSAQDVDEFCSVYYALYHLWLSIEHKMQDNLSDLSQ